MMEGKGRLRGSLLLLRSMVNVIGRAGKKGRWQWGPPFWLRLWLKGIVSLPCFSLIYEAQF